MVLPSAPGAVQRPDPVKVPAGGPPLSPSGPTQPTAPTGGAPPRPRRRRRALALAFGVGPLLAALGLAEVVVRLRWERLLRPDEGALRDGTSLGEALRAEVLRSPVLEPGAAASDLYALDPARSFRLRPGARTTRRVVDDRPDPVYVVTTDRRGLRGPDRPDPPPGALRVLALGDSMTFGKGVDDEATFCARLEARLGAALAPRPARVWNAGVISYGQHEELAALRELAPDLRPDVVLLVFTVANDVTDDMRWLEGRTPLTPDPEGAAALAAHPALVGPWAASRLWRLGAWRYLRHVLRYRAMADDAALDRAARLVLACRDAAAAAGARFAVAVAPSVVQVEGHWAARVARIDAIPRGLRARLAAAGVPVLDPTPALAARAAEGLFIPLDLHFNPRGHEAFAEALAPFVLAQVAAR